MKFLFDSDNKIIFKKLLIVTIIFSALNAMFVFELIEIMGLFLEGLAQHLAIPVTELLVMIIDGNIDFVLNDSINFGDFGNGEEIIITVFVIFSKLLVVNMAYMIAFLIYLKKGIENLNEEIKFTKFRIKKRIIFGSYLLMSLTNVLISSLIPFVGSMLASYLFVIFYDVYLVNSLRDGTMNLNFSNIKSSLNKHKFFALKIFLIGIIIDFAVIGLIIFVVNVSIHLSVNLIAIVVVLVTLLLAIGYIYYMSVILTYLIKNSGNVEKVEKVELNDPIRR